MNKSVLIVTPFFAPQSHAPVFRMQKLAKYLPEYGWKPYVLTVDTNYTYNEDPGLLDELPPEVEICRTRYIEPSLRGVRMALGGKDRTFSAQKEMIVEKEDNNLSAIKSADSNGIFRKAYNYLLNRHLKNPDAFWSWRITALKKAKKLVSKHDIPVVLTTFPPHSSFIIGARLQEEMDIKWVADFRDPGTYENRSAPAYKSVYWEQKNIERSTLAKADYKVVTSSVYPVLFDERFGDHQNNYTQIPTGVDKRFMPEYSLKKKNQLVFVGEFLKEYRERFFKIFQLAKDNHNEVMDDCKLVVVGHKSINKKLIKSSLKNYNLEEDIQFIDHLPQKELYEILKKSKAALLMSGRSRFSCNYAKMVDYIGLQVPVIADVPEISEARNELTKAGLGIFLDGTTEENAEKMAAFINGEITVTPDSEYCQKYLATQQVKRFGEVLNKVIDKH